MIRVNGCEELNIQDLLDRSPVGQVPMARETLEKCMSISIGIRCGMLDDKVACMWGLIPPTILSTRAYLWLLTTDIVAEHKFLFVRHSQRYVEEMLELYPEIYGDVLADNAAAKRWLRWLGAKINPPNGKISTFVIRKGHP